MRIWNFCCSLKLAIVLASLATFLLMGGSLLFPSNPGLFDPLDRMSLAKWLTTLAAASPGRSWWFLLFLVAMLCLLLNTLCCLIDWVLHLTARWRKTGEYLLHLGVILLLCGYIWGAVGGWRQVALPCPVGSLTPLSSWPGHFLAVDSFQPVFAPSGQPTDMISQVRLLAGEELLAAGEVRTNRPLLQDGLVITPLSFGRKADGFLFSLAGRKTSLRAGDRVRDEQGNRFQVLRFLPDARVEPNGQIRFRDDRVGSPALEIRLATVDGRSWQGWYFLAQGPPPALRSLRLQPIEPLYASISILTINYDPGAKLAAAGAILAAAGCFLALISYYRKRTRQDRPEL